jgi:hypothetical protein
MFLLHRVYLKYWYRHIEGILHNETKVRTTLRTNIRLLFEFYWKITFQNKRLNSEWYTYNRYSNIIFLNSSLITEQYLVFIKTHFATNVQNVLHLNRYSHRTSAHRFLHHVKCAWTVANGLTCINNLVHEASIYLLFIFYLQLGWHPVVAVQNTFTHKQYT